MIIENDYDIYNLRNPKLNTNIKSEISTIHKLKLGNHHKQIQLPNRKFSFDNNAVNIQQRTNRTKLAEYL